MLTISAVAVAVTLAVTCLVGWLALRATLFDISERGSLLIAGDLAPLAGADLAASGRLSSRVLGPGTTVVAAVRADGTVALTPGEDVTIALGQAEADAAHLQQPRVVNTTASTGETYRLVTVPLGGQGESDWALVVGRPLTSSYEVLRVFGLVVLVVGVAGIGWAWLLGRTIAQTALTPMRRFTAAMRHVADTEDLHPVGLTSSLSELSVKSDTFNAMLTRLADSREQQNRLIADASHELRTPLTSLRTNLELLALDETGRRLTRTQRRQMFADVQAQTVEFTTLIADLVHLSREKHTDTREPLDLRSVVQTALNRIRRRRPDVTFNATLDSLHLNGDRAGLEQTVTNLLDNAAKWSPAGATVHVDLTDQQLRVADEGPGIPDADLTRVFDRFYRAETARSTPGAGLGLAIAAKTTRDHDGTLTAARSTTHGGAELTLTLPGAPELSQELTPDPTSAPTPEPTPEPTTEPTVNHGASAGGAPAPRQLQDTSAS